MKISREEGYCIKNWGEENAYCIKHDQGNAYCTKLSNPLLTSCGEPLATWLAVQTFSQVVITSIWSCV